MAPSSEHLRHAGGDLPNRLSVERLLPAPLRVVMQTLAHSQISLTANTQPHLRQAIQQEAAERPDAVLSAG